MKLRNIGFLILVLLAFALPSWAIGIAGSAGGKRVTVSVDGTWQGTYAAGTTYVVGDIVTDGTTNYRSLQNSNTGHTPASSPLYWQAILAKGDTGPTGATGPQGPTGAAGVNGKTVLTTSGAPASGTGVDGDYAYDPATYTMYGPKASGAWPAGTVIKGADGAGFTSGADGTYGWLTDSNTSSYTECASGKYGLNFVGGVLYQCSNGTNSVFTSGDSLPTQTGNSGKYLTTNGTAASWGTIAAGSGIAISTDIPTEAGAANLNDTTHVLTVASSTGYTQFTGSYTAWDTTPESFAFTDETDIALSTAKTSNAITVAGINSAAAISVTGDTGFGYSKNSAVCTATSGTIVAGDTVAACVTSSGSNSTETTATVTIGGVSGVYSVTTAAGQASLSMSPSSHDFGSVNTGSSGTAQTFTVLNSGTAIGSLGTFSISGTNSDQFSMSSNTCTSTLAAGSSCSLSVNFSPTSTGIKSSVVGDGLLSSDLSGTGTSSYTLLRSSEVGTNQVSLGSGTGSQIIGQRLATGSSATNIRRIGFYVAAKIGNPLTADYSYVGKIYNVSSFNLTSAVATSSNVISGANITVGSWIYFDFDSAVTLNNNMVFAVYSNTTNSSNYILLYKDNTNDNDSAFSTQGSWNATGTFQAGSGDLQYRIYQ